MNIGQFKWKLQTEISFILSTNIAKNVNEITKTENIKIKANSK